MAKKYAPTDNFIPYRKRERVSFSPDLLRNLLKGNRKRCEPVIKYFMDVSGVEPGKVYRVVDAEEPRRENGVQMQCVTISLGGKRTTIVNGRCLVREG